MIEDRVTKWVGIATNVAVLAGVFLLVVEIRQNNDLAAFQSIQERKYMQQQSEMAFYDLEMAEIWTKSIFEPKNLTLAEIRAMDAYLAFSMNRASQMVELEAAGLVPAESAKEYIEGDLFFVLGNEFGQIWWERVGAPGWPELADVVNPYVETLDPNSVKNDFLTIQEALEGL